MAQGVWGAAMPPTRRPEGGSADPEALSDGRRPSPHRSLSNLRFGSDYLR
jgi:hypothetical protein